jgi:hypothetical protein
MGRRAAKDKKTGRERQQTKEAGWGGGGGKASPECKWGEAQAGRGRAQLWAEWSTEQEGLWETQFGGGGLISGGSAKGRGGGGRGGVVRGKEGRRLRGPHLDGQGQHATLCEPQHAVHLTLMHTQGGLGQQACALGLLRAHCGAQQVQRARRHLKIAQRGVALQEHHTGLHIHTWVHART